MSVEVRPVQSRAERKTFIRFPWKIYPGRYPAWVPPLLTEEHKRIDPKKNPFFGHGDVELFVAYRDGEVAVLDTDEFEEHRRVFGYPPDVVDTVRGTAERLARALEERMEPFGTAALPWLPSCWRRQRSVNGARSAPTPPWLT